MDATDVAKAAELLARLREAEGPSRSLDAAIHAIESTELNPDSECEAQEDGSVRVYFGNRLVGRRAAPRYTESIDAAVTLVTPDCDWLINSRGNYATVWRSKESGLNEHYAVQAATPALALCIAALLARGSDDRPGVTVTLAEDDDA